MITDPLFIFGMLGMILCLYSWIKFNINEELKESIVVKNISTISFISGAFVLMSIFTNSGDLGIVLFFGSIVSLLVMLLGFILKNKNITTTSRGYFIPIFLIFVLRTFLFEPYQIPSGSMEPQLKKGDFLLVNKFAYGLKINRIGIPSFLRSEPQYGDPVVIIPPHNPVPYIKRLVGKPNDVIRIINKQLFVNGVPLERSFIKSEEITLKKRYLYSSGETIVREMNATGDLFYERNGSAEYIIRNTRDENQQYPQEWVVPDDHYFVMGDNRDNSNDSTKDVGFVPRANFFGRADILWMSWECWTCIPSFEKVGKIN